jgi:hypothetical protein
MPDSSLRAWTELIASDSPVDSAAVLDLGAGLWRLSRAAAAAQTSPTELCERYDVLTFTA